jgi:surface protein
MILFPTADEDYQYFVSEGYNGSINDMHYQALGDLGYTGSYTDRLYSYLVATYGDYHQALYDLRSGVSTFALTGKFMLTVATTTASETFTIPCQDAGTFNATIDWGDNSTPSIITAYNDAALTHTYATAGDHVIRITGTFPNIYFNDGGDKLKVKSVENFGEVGWTRADEAFWGCSNMTSFTSGTTDTSALLYMNNMFRGCTSLTTLDVSGFDTSSVTSLFATFYECSSLTTLDISGFDTSSVTSFNNTWGYCAALTSLDVSGFDTSLATSMRYMFNGCTSLTALDVSGFNTALVYDMLGMFSGCSSLTSLDVSSFNTAAVTSMSSTFRDCTNLTSLDVSSFNTAIVSNMNTMFYNCSSLTSLDVSSFNTATVNDMSFMFYNCASVTDIIGVDTFDIGGLNSTTDLNDFATIVTLPTARYDALLIAWEAQDPFDGMAPNFGSSTYTGGGAVATARASLISRDGWTITDGGIA